MQIIIGALAFFGFYEDTDFSIFSKDIKLGIEICMKTKLKSLTTFTGWWLLVLICTFAACEKKHEEPILDGGPGVYVAGANDKQGVCWKDGRIVAFQGAAAIYSIVISPDKQVHAAGSSTDGATYWLNGTPVSLRSGFMATSMALSGTDVFVAGLGTDGGREHPLAWKNGTRILWSETDSYSASRVNPAIAVSGKDYYVVGKHNYRATCWKNGVEVPLGPDGDYNFVSYSEANSILIVGDDVYVAGTYRSKAAYWKNGVQVTLPGGFQATSIFVSGNDVYVSGTNYYLTTHPVAKYWKNGIGTELTEKYSDAYARSIVVSNGDIYVVGSEKHVAKYWKNRVEVILSEYDSDAFS